MPSPKSHRRGGTEEKNRKGRLAEKAMSFSGQSGGSTAVLLQRPRTVPDLLAGRRCSSAGSSQAAVQFPPKLTKLLLNVTIQRSTGALQVLISPDSTVDDLIAAALRQYVKEGRRPVLPSTTAAHYGLHYSQFSLESKLRFIYAFLKSEPLKKNYAKGSDWIISFRSGQEREAGGVGFTELLPLPGNGSNRRRQHGCRWRNDVVSIFQLF